MTDPKKPGDNNLNDLKARLGLPQPGGAGSAQPEGGSSVPAPPGGIAPPAFGPGASAPASTPPGSNAPPVVPPPGIGSGAPVGPAPGGDVPPPAVGSTAPPERQSNVPPPAVSPAASGNVAPPSFAPPGGGGVPAPAFGQQAANVAPPPFAQQEDDEEPEEEIIREERVVKIEADDSIDSSEAGRSNLAPYIGVIIAFVIAGLFGYLAGAQIDRAVRANRAIDAAVTIHNALIADQELAKGLKSRISGAARKAIDADSPAADFNLINHLAKVREERPFSAEVWSGQFYQAFKSRQLVFEYYRTIQELWDTVDQVATKYQDPATARAIKSWPEERQRILELNDTKGASGYGVAFRANGDKVLAVLGVFKNSRRERAGSKVVYQSEFSPLGSNAEKTLTEYQPGFDALSENPDEYFIRFNPDGIVGKKRQVIVPGGPIINEAQEPYRDYLQDLNKLSKAVQNVQAQQDDLIQALSDIRQARRPFTFGF